ncbi:MAG TPA: hypothetical protein VII47_05060 [Actinomycetota bacterium]|jgi:hypothetical protein
MARLKTMPVALAGVSALASKFLLIDRFRKPKPKRRVGLKVVKIAVPGLLAIGAGGTLLKIRKGGAGRSRNFSLVGGAGPAPSNNSQTRPATPETPPETEASSNKK